MASEVIDGAACAVEYADPANKQGREQQFNGREERVESRCKGDLSVNNDNSIERHGLTTREGRREAGVWVRGA